LQSAYPACICSDTLREEGIFPFSLLSSSQNKEKRQFSSLLPNHSTLKMYSKEDYLLLRNNKLPTNKTETSCHKIEKIFFFFVLLKWYTLYRTWLGVPSSFLQLLTNVSYSKYSNLCKISAW